jgi:Vacuolar protein sorting-associated protein 62
MDPGLTAANARALFRAAVVLLALTAAPTGHAAGPEQELADHYAPIVALKDREGECGLETVKGEEWRPTRVEIVLGNDEVHLRGPGGGRPVVTDAPTAADLHGKGSDYFLDFPGNPLRPGCVYAEDGRRFAEGEPSVAYAHIVAEGGRLAIEYWFYYYFNDFNNKHESDWEGIQVVFDVGTVEEALETEPVEVGFAQHEGGEWAEWDDDKLERVGDHPVVYPAAGSHASYFSDRLWLGRSPKEGIGCDDSTAPSHQVELSAVVVPDEPPASPDDPFAWLAYEGLWGQLEQGPNAGPTGPNTKDRWSEPITWQDDLRGGSVSVPALQTFGSTATGAFCGVIGFAAGLYIEYLAEPLITILVIVGVVALIALLVWRTHWRPTRPEPIRARRETGQILLAAGRIYGRNPLRYLALASIVLVLGFMSTGLDWLLRRLPSDLTISLSLDWLATLLGSVAIALVLRNLDSGRRLGCVAAYRLVFRRFWSLLGAAAIVVLVQLAILLTIVGIPVAVYRLVRRLFAFNEVVLRRRSARSAPNASVALVRGHWWRTALFALLLYFIAISIGPAVGIALLFQTRLSPTLINVIGSLTYFAVFPYVAIAAALLYFDLGERRREADEAAASSSGETT